MLGAAQAKGIHIKDVEVHAEFKRNISPKFHGDYHGDPERRKLAIGLIRTSYYIHGDVSEEQKRSFSMNSPTAPFTTR